MENVWFNYMDVIKDARMKQPRFSVHGSVLFGFCRVSACIISGLTLQIHTAAVFFWHICILFFKILYSAFLFFGSMQ